MIRNLNPCLLLFLFLLSVSSFANAPKQTDLTEAARNKTVQVKPIPAGGLGANNLSVKIRNLTNKVMQLRVPPGLHFKADDPNSQDLLTAREELLALEPGKEKTIQMSGYCMNANNYSPRPGAAYTFNGYAPPALKTLADSLNKYPKVAEDYGQMFVWAITDKRELYDISVSGTLVPAATNILKYVARQTGRPETKVYKSSGESRKPSVEMFSKTVTIMFQNPKNDVASFKIYNADGKVYRTLYENRKVSHGVVKYAVGLNEIIPAGNNPVYYLKVINQKGKVLAEKKVDKYTTEENKEPNILSFKFSYTLEKAVKNAAIRVYLEDGTLVEEFMKYPYLGAGGYNVNLKLAHLYPANTKFETRLEAEDGTIIKKQTVGAGIE